MTEPSIARTESNPFLDPTRVGGDLYRDRGRLARRSSALLRAKISGRPVPDVIVDIAREQLASAGRQRTGERSHQVLDVGCGRGSSTLALTAAFPDAHITMLDLSRDLLSAGLERIQSAGRTARAVQADFHRLPLRGGHYDLIVAAFCLYHAREPSVVIEELARCLRGTGTAILVTKSEDSYRELDSLMMTAGLDSKATTRNSLYEMAHSGNIEELVRTGLHVKQVVHERHTFRFDTLAHVAEYVATTPKYQLPSSLEGQAKQIADALRKLTPEGPVVTSSTVTYVVARRPRPALPNLGGSGEPGHRE